jgi:hypothetical protein
MLQEAASASLGDWFEFLIESPLLDLDAAPCGGARFPVEARMDARTFAKFAIDVAVGDAVIEPVESVEWGGWLAFPRRSPNRRVKDLIDLATLVRSRELDPAKAGSAIEVTFGRRGTHAVPRLLDPAPEVWRKQFAEMAEQCLGGAAMDGAFSDVQRFFAYSQLTDHEGALDRLSRQAFELGLYDRNEMPNGGNDE